MKNPILKAREKLGLTIKEFALLAGTVEVTVRTNERGENVAVTPKILNYLAEQGFDQEKIEKDYAAFRQWKIKQISKKVVAQ